MPRSIQDILDHADELARRFEDYNPGADEGRDARPLAAVRDAVLARSGAERDLAHAVAAARAAGQSWAAIGGVLGTSGQAARERYAHLQKT